MDMPGPPNLQPVSLQGGDKLAMSLGYIITTVSDSFLVDVIKYLSGSDLKGGGFVFGLQSKAIQSIMVKTWQQEGKAGQQEQVGHDAVLLRKQRVNRN